MKLLSAKRRLSLAMLVAVLSWSSMAEAAPVRVQHANNSAWGTNPNLLTTAYGSNVVSGNVSIVIVRGSYLMGAVVSSVTDTRSTTYAQVVVSNDSFEPYLWIYVGTFGSSGADTVTVTFNLTDANYVWVEIIEVSGITTVGAVSATTSTSGATDQVCGPLTTSTGAYWVMGASMEVAASYTAGTDSNSHVWTLIDGTLDASGGAQEYIAASAKSSNTAHITGSTSSGSYATVCAAFLETAGAASPKRFLLLGVGK